ncbi:hypothetical protein K3X44_11050 [Aliiroseovarius crassostreae]|uniref:hypothetical protein n=1 Tax=Aliiroseovarius crassostreae TaxID=154981 RepID=UPI002202680F|nr:hypothetical protein [Aliiroseovarius crassostreae]UWQ01034.1 hypothetical protein K3X44_11050 [Aliiroseovarius crassostreae]
MKPLVAIHYSFKLVSIVAILLSSLTLLVLLSMILNGEWSVEQCLPTALVLFALCCSILALSRGSWYMFLEGGIAVASIVWFFSAMHDFFEELSSLDEVDVATVLEPEAVESFHDVHDFLFSTFGMSGLVLAVASICAIRYHIWSIVRGN